LLAPKVRCHFDILAKGNESHTYVPRGNGADSERHSPANNGSGQITPPRRTQNARVADSERRGGVPITPESLNESLSESLNESLCLKDPTLSRRADSTDSDLASKESSEQESPPSRTEPLTSRPVSGDMPEPREDDLSLGQPSLDPSSRLGTWSSPETAQGGQRGGYSAANGNGAVNRGVPARFANGISPPSPENEVALDDDDPAWLAIEHGLEPKPLKIRDAEFGGLPPPQRNGHPSDIVPGPLGDALRRLRTGLTAMSS
jgi:hypothetical protein